MQRFYWSSVLLKIPIIASFPQICKSKPVIFHSFDNTDGRSNTCFVFYDAWPLILTAGSQTKITSWCPKLFESRLEKSAAWFSICGQIIVLGRPTNFYKKLQSASMHDLLEYCPHDTARSSTTTFYCTVKRFLNLLLHPYIPSSKALEIRYYLQSYQMLAEFPNSLNSCQLRFEQLEAPKQEKFRYFC